MKKLLLLLAVLLLSCPAFASEKQQEQKVTQAYGAIGVQKQPTQENAPQAQTISKVYGCIIIQVQGKVPFDKTENQPKEEK